MLKASLFWRVLANFGLLLLILTIMTYLMLDVLGRMEHRFLAARADISPMSDLMTLDNLLVDVPKSVDEYVHLRTPLAKRSFEESWRSFDRIVSQLEKSLADSSYLPPLAEARVLFIEWGEKIGDRKIRLAEENRKPEEFVAQLREIKKLETERRYLARARARIDELARKLISTQSLNVEAGTQLSREVTRFITLVIVLFAVFAIALGFVLTRSITSPLQKLKRGTQQIMAGEFTTIDLRRSDELGQLAADFNKMSTMLGSNYTRLKAYSELITALNSVSGLKEVQKRSLQILSKHTDAAVGALYLVDPGTGRLVLVEGHALKDGGASVREFAIGEGIPGACLAQQRILEITDVADAREFPVDTGLVEVVPRYIFAVPIQFHDRTIGVMLLGSMQPFDDMKKEIINNSVPQVGVAIANAQNYEATEKLSREIAKKNEELNSKNRELEKAYRVKSDFLSSMSHELRTPLNSIIGFTSVLLGPGGDELSPDQRMALEKVLKNGRHLLQLINDILDFSKLESGRMTVTFETDEAANVVANSVLTVEALVAAKKLTVRQELPQDLPVLRTDVLKVKQILVNLLSNAVKFTERGEIVVSVRKENGMMSFAVKDSGIGIEEKNLALVFEEFQQIESSNSRKYKGTGLGLPISRKLARLLGGDLTVQSVFGKGSTFTLTIPATHPDYGKGKPETPPAPETKPTVKPGAIPSRREGGEGARILCIDDDPDSIEILRNYLVPEGYSVTEALSGDEGIKLARQISPALITLDIMMPQKDGWEVLRELKEHPTTRDIPVVIHSIIDNKPLAVSLGALDVMPKPVEPARLLEMVKHACQSKDEYVFLVDDNEDFTMALRQLVEAEGFKVKSATSGEQALKELEHFTPAIMFLDLMMPGMDGFEVVRRLQNRKEWSRIPIVILSGKELTDEEREQLNSHIAQFVQKADFSRDTIISAINRILHSEKIHAN